MAVRGTPPPAPGGVTFGGKPIARTATLHESGATAAPEPDAPHHVEPVAPPPAWPAGILPDALERYADSQARSIGVPLDMIAVPLLVFAGGTVGNMVRLQLKPTWNVFPTLWAGVIGEPSDKKSPTLGAAQWPVNELQNALYERWQAEKAEYDAEHVDKKGSGFPPKLEHIFTTDATMEALTRILSESRGVTIIKDELSGFIGGMDKYRGGKGKGDDRQNYLSLWAGTTIKADRVTGGTLYAAHPVAGVYGGIQPDIAGTLHNRDGARDGMVERFLLYWPEVRRTGWSDDTVDVSLVDDSARLFAALRRFMPDDRITVKMAPDARRVFIDWYNANDAAIACVAGLRRGFYGKLDSQLARVALVLHCLHNPDDPRPMVSVATIRAAIEVAEFFRRHLDRVLPLIGDSSTGEPVGLEARVLRYLRTPGLHDSDGWVRRGRLLHKLGNVPADDLTSALDSLQHHGIVETRTVGSATKPSEQWRIQDAPASKNSNISTFSGPSGDRWGDSSNTSNSSSGQDDDTDLQPTGTDGSQPGEVKI